MPTSVSVKAYVDYWGLHASSYYDSSDGSMTNSSTVASYFADGETVKKTVSADGAEYTLNLAQAKLQRITKNDITFGDILNLPPTVNDWSGDNNGAKIRWNGPTWRRLARRSTGATSGVAVATQKKFRLTSM